MSAFVFVLIASFAACYSPIVDREAPRLQFLDGLRASAALLVLLYHMQLEVFAPLSPAANYLGRMSVDVFIVLSGFCLMMPALRNGVRLREGAFNFFLRRARRILPPYYGALALTLFLIWGFIGKKTGTHWDVAIPVTGNAVLANVLMLQNFVHRYEINYAFWSIATEWQIYFLFPLLLMSWRSFGAAITTLLSVAASLMAFTLLHRTALAEVTVHFVGLFTLGMAGTALATRKLPWRLITTMLWTLVAILVGLGWATHITAPRSAMLDMLVGVAAMALVVTIVRHPHGWLDQIFSAKPLAGIGVFSYSLYLVHAPLLHLVWLYALKPFHLGHQMTFSLLVAAGGPAIVGAAYLFYLVLERPFMRRAPVPVPRLTVFSL